MRILHVISSLDPRDGGPSTALAGLARAQKAAGLNVRILASHRSKDDLSIAESLPVEGIPVKLIGPTHGKLRTHPKLGEAIADALQIADIVHVHAIWEMIQAQSMRACRKQGIPYIVRPCGMLDPWSLRQNRYLKSVYYSVFLRDQLAGATRIHYTTRAEAFLASPLQIGTRKVIAPNGIDFEAYQQTQSRLLFEEMHPSLKHNPYILFMGRIHEKKGLDYLIPAFASSRMAGSHMLIIAGPIDLQYQKKLLKTISRSRISDRIFFTGMVDGPRKLALLQHADFMILPSRQENFGNVVVESLAAGTPVLLSDRVNLAEDVVPARVGRAIYLTLEGLRRSLNDLADDPNWKQSVSLDCRAFARRYDWSIIARKWVRMYRSLRKGETQHARHRG